jgi:hypothetical protein
MARDNASMNPVSSSLWLAMATATCQFTLAWRKSGVASSIWSYLIEQL